MLRWGDWLDQASEEFSAAETLAAAGHHAWACFTCQQAAGKALKAVLEFRDAGTAGHNLLDLVRAVSEDGEVPDEIRHAARRLNRLYIPTRSPDAHASGVPAHQYGAEDARDALEDSRAVLEFARALLRPPPGPPPGGGPPPPHPGG